MIKVYKKKPVKIEALYFTGDNFKECETFIEGNFDNTLNYPNIKTLEGVMAVSEGDFIIKGVKGEFYPCKPDILKLLMKRSNKLHLTRHIRNDYTSYMPRTLCSIFC